jgi:hypothetical protein
MVSHETRGFLGLPLVLLLLGAVPGDAVGGETRASKGLPQLPQTVTVLERSLTLKSKESSPSEDLVAEYVPAAETLDHWTLMLAVRIFKAKLAPDKAVAMKEQEIGARRAQGDFMANSISFAKDDVRLIDFVLSQSPIVEHNLMSFRTRPDGRLVSYQLARRYYQPTSEVDDGLRAFMGEIKTKRDTYVRELDRAAKGLE